MELLSVVRWHNGFRPRSTLGGRTLGEVYFKRRAANRSPGFEPRRR